MEDRIKRLILSEDDICDALRACKYIVKHRLYNDTVDIKEKGLGRHLQCSMMIAYSRPFSENSRNPTIPQRPKLPLKDKLPQDLLEIHRYIHIMRNKVFAHTDAEVSDVQFEIVSSYEGGYSCNAISIGNKHMFELCFYLKCKELFDKVLLIIRNEIREEAKRIKN